MFMINESVKKEINEWLKKYPPEQKRSAVIKALLLVQEQNEGWLSVPAMDAVADYLELPKIAVYEVANFYDLYELKPVGKHKIAVCTNVSCMLRGSDKIVETLKKRLGIELGETTNDGLYTLREVECMAACGGAPMCQINNKQYIEHLTPEKMNQILDQLDAGTFNQEVLSDG